MIHTDRLSDKTQAPDGRGNEQKDGLTKLKESHNRSVLIVVRSNLTYFCRF